MVGVDSSMEIYYIYRTGWMDNNKAIYYIYHIYWWMDSSKAIYYIYHTYYNNRGIYCTGCTGHTGQVDNNKDYDCTGYTILVDNNKDYDYIYHTILVDNNKVIDCIDCNIMEDMADKGKDTDTVVDKAGGKVVDMVDKVYYAPLDLLDLSDP